MTREHTLKKNLASVTVPSLLQGAAFRRPKLPHLRQAPLRPFLISEAEPEARGRGARHGGRLARGSGFPSGGASWPPSHSVARDGRRGTLGGCCLWRRGERGDAQVWGPQSGTISSGEPSLSGAQQNPGLWDGDRGLSCGHRDNGPQEGKRAVETEDWALCAFPGPTSGWHFPFWWAVFLPVRSLIQTHIPALSQELEMQKLIDSSLKGRRCWGRQIITREPVHVSRLSLTLRRSPPDIPRWTARQLWS